MSTEKVNPSVSDESRSIESFDTEEDKKLVRKIDWHLLPILTLLYLLSFLDRSNIGNTKVVGLTTDLNVVGANYNTALALYFVGYVLFEVPSNIVLKRFDPAIWLPSLTLLWGIVSITQGLVQNQDGLFGVRFLLGVSEAGLFPGVIFLFSLYYRRRERTARVAIFFGGASLAGAFGGIFAYAIGHINTPGYHGWRWIFILEGLLTVLVSIFAFWIVPSWPHKAKFLTEEERARLAARLLADSSQHLQEKFDWYYVRRAFTDHLVWAYAFLFHGFAFVLYSLSLFLPTIIAALGYEAWKTQLLTVPPNTVASVVIWGTVWLTTRVHKQRAPFIIAAAFLAIIGYVLLLTTQTASLRYFGVHLAVAGVYTGNSLLLSWPSENVAGQTKRAVAVAMQISIGDIGAIAGVLVYRPELSQNNFRLPHIISIGYLLFAVLVTLYLWISMSRENARRETLRVDKGLVTTANEGGDLNNEKYVLGDRALDFRYQL